MKAEVVDVVKHSAVESAFSYYLTKPGRIDAKFHRMLIDARKIREIADYDIQEEIVQPTVTLKLEEGRSFVAMIINYISALKPEETGSSILSNFHPQYRPSYADAFAVAAAQEYRAAVVTGDPDSRG